MYLAAQLPASGDLSVMVGLRLYCISPAVGVQAAKPWLCPSNANPRPDDSRLSLAMGTEQPSRSALGGISPGPPPHNWRGVCRVYCSRNRAQTVLYVHTNSSYENSLYDYSLPVQAVVLPVLKLWPSSEGPIVGGPPRTVAMEIWVWRHLNVSIG
jgi:hypothetical protein